MQLNNLTNDITSPLPQFKEATIADLFDYSNEAAFIESCKLVHRLWSKTNPQARIELNYEVDFEGVKAPIYKLIAKKQFNNVIADLDTIVDFTQPDALGNSFLHYTILESNEFLTATILKKFNWLLFLQNKEGTSSLELLDKSQSSKIKEMGENAIQNLDEKDFINLSLTEDLVKELAFLFAKLGKRDLLNILITSFSGINFKQLENNKENLFTTAIKAQQMAIVVMLLARKFKLNAIKGIDEIECAVVAKNADAVKVFAFFGSIIDRDLSEEARTLLTQPAQCDYLLLSLSTESAEILSQKSNASEVSIDIDIAAEPEKLASTKVGKIYSINTFVELAAIYQALSLDSNNNNTNSYVETFKNYLAYLNTFLHQDDGLLWQSQKEMVAQRLNTLFYNSSYTKERKHIIASLYRAFHETTLVDHVIHHYLKRGVTQGEINRLFDFELVLESKKISDTKKQEISEKRPQIIKVNDFERLQYFPWVLRQRGEFIVADKFEDRLLATPVELIDVLSTFIDELKLIQQIYINDKLQLKILIGVSIGALVLLEIITGIPLVVTGVLYQKSHTIPCEDKSSSKEVHPENNDPICFDESYNQSRYHSLFVPGLVLLILGVIVAIPGALSFEGIDNQNLLARFFQRIFYVIMTPPKDLCQESLDKITETFTQIDENLPSYAKLKNFMDNIPTPIHMNNVDQVIQNGEDIQQELTDSSYIPLFDIPAKHAFKTSDRVEVLEELTHYPVDENSIESMDEEEEEIPLLTLKQRQMPGLLK